MTGRLILESIDSLPLVGRPACRTGRVREGERFPDTPSPIPSHQGRGNQEKTGISVKILKSVLIVSFIFLNGCAKLAHMQELLTLKAMSDNGDEQRRFVAAQDARFETLLEKVKNNQLGEYPNRKSVFRAFGEPIFTKQVQRNDQTQEQWLYRYATKFFDSPKVYLYFNPKGKVIDWQYVATPEKK